VCERGGKLPDFEPGSPREYKRLIVHCGARHNKVATLQSFVDCGWVTLAGEVDRQLLCFHGDRSGLDLIEWQSVRWKPCGLTW
jgi:hypothetical protein